MSGLHRPLWTTHFASGEVRIIETHGGTIRVLVAGGQMEVGYALAERIARELLRAVRGKLETPKEKTDVR